MKAFFDALLDGADTGRFMVVGFREGGAAAVRSCAVGDSPADLVEAITEEGRNLYWGAALMRDDLPAGSRGKADDVTAMLAIVVDLDDANAAATWHRRVAEAPCPLEPSAIIRTSSHPAARYQLVYLLREPETDIEAWRTAARRLEQWFGGDWCCKDPAHVWRVPETMNYPNAKKQREGRAPELATLVKLDPSIRYDVHVDFDELPEPTEPEVSEQPVTVAALPVMSGRWEGWGEILAHLPTWMQKDILTDNVKRDHAGSPDRSGWDYQIAAECARAGLTVADFVELYHLAPAGEVFAQKWAEKERAKTGAGDQYLVQTFARAASKVASEPRVETTVEDTVVEDTTVEPPPRVRWSAWAFGVTDIEKMPEPDIEYLIEPWLPKGSIVMVHGITGGGKSYFIQHQTYNLALGQSVGPFFVNQPRRVLYIDAEMGRVTIDRRMRSLARAYGRDTERRFLYWAPSMTPKDAGVVLNILDPTVQGEIEAMVEDLGAEIVVIDNVRSSAPGMDENDAKSWGPLNDWFRRVRDRLGVTILWVHHDNKAVEGRSYAGSSNALTASEVVVQVKNWAEDRRDGARVLMGEWKFGHVDEDGVWHDRPSNEFSLTHGIDISYTKNREFDPSIHKKASLIYVSDNVRELTRMLGYADSPLHDEGVKAQLSLMEQAYAAAKSGVPQKEIAVMLGVAQGTVSKWVAKVEADPASRDRVTRLAALKVIWE